MSTYKNANYGINRIGGEGKGSTKGQGIYEESSYAKFDLGEKLELIDGRVFRYGYFGSAVAAGVLVSQDVSATAVVETNNIATAAAIGAPTSDIKLNIVYSSIIVLLRIFYLLLLFVNQNLLKHHNHSLILLLDLKI